MTRSEPCRWTDRVDAKALANLFLDWAGDAGIVVSPMKLQKLLFFAHADFLARTGKPLLKQEFEAWDYGPVIPNVYREFKRFKGGPILAKASSFDPISASTIMPTCELAAEVESILREVFGFYSKLSAIHLSELSHEFEGAWRQARSLFANGMNMDRRISNEMIIACHRPIHS
jgi:uncharacterized phage-associated protein